MVPATGGRSDTAAGLLRHHNAPRPLSPTLSTRGGVGEYGASNRRQISNSSGPGAPPKSTTPPFPYSQHMWRGGGIWCQQQAADRIRRRAWCASTKHHAPFPLLSAHGEGWGRYGASNRRQISNSSGPGASPESTTPPFANSQHTWRGFWGYGASNRRQISNSSGPGASPQSTTPPFPNSQHTWRGGGIWCHQQAADQQRQRAWCATTKHHAPFFQLSARDEGWGGDMVPATGGRSATAAGLVRHHKAPRPLSPTLSTRGGVGGDMVLATGGRSATAAGLVRHHKAPRPLSQTLSTRGGGLGDMVPATGGRSATAAGLVRHHKAPRPLSPTLSTRGGVGDMVPATGGRSATAAGLVRHHKAPRPLSPTLSTRGGVGGYGASNRRQISNSSGPGASPQSTSPPFPNSHHTWRGGGNMVPATGGRSATAAGLVRHHKAPRPLSPTLSTRGGVGGYGASNRWQIRNSGGPGASPLSTTPPFPYSQHTWRGGGGGIWCQQQAADQQRR